MSSKGSSFAELRRRAGPSIANSVMNAVPKGPVTDTLIAINVAIWLVLLVFGLTDVAAIEGGFIPARFGAAPGGLITHQFLLPALVTPITAAFLHAGVLHLLVNMAMLLFTGRFVEMALGRWPFAILYVAGIFGAAIGEYIASAGSWAPMVGASGPGSAVLAAYMLLFSRSRSQRTGPVPAYYVRAATLLAMWVILNLATSFALGEGGIRIAVGAHIGGFIAGLVLVRPLLEWRYRDA